MVTICATVETQTASLFSWLRTTSSFTFDINDLESDTRRMPVEKYEPSWELIKEALREDNLSEGDLLR